MADKKISELDAVLQINNDAVFPMSQDNAGEPTTFKAGITQLGAEIAEDMTFSNLQTTSKKIVGAINEIAQGGGGTTDYEDLENKPQINSVELSGNKSLDDLGIQPSEISKSASGSIATFTDGGDNIPVKSFECEIVAQQASGTPTPVSPLSITGFDSATIRRDNKNLISLVSDTVQTNRQTSITINSISDNSIDMTSGGLAYACFGRYIYLKAGKYTVSLKAIASDSYNPTATMYKGSSTIVSGINNTTPKTFTASTDGIYELRMFATGSGDTTIRTVTYSEIQIEKGEDKTDFVPYKGNAYLVEFGQTIYGGRLIYSNGQWSIKATYEIVDLGTLEWTKDTVTLSVTVFRAPIDNRAVGDLYGKCEIYLVSNDTRNFLVNNNLAMTRWNATGTTIAVRDDSLSSGSATDFTTAVSGAHLVYELATPVFIPITSSTRVKTISGANNIFSNTGDVELEYFTENADEIAELIETEIDGERQEHNVVKSYTAKLTSSQYGWFTFVDENGNDLLVTNGVPLSASAIADSKYYSGLFVQQPSGKIFFKVVDVNNSSASSFAPVGTSLSNITFNLSYLKF